MTEIVLTVYEAGFLNWPTMLCDITVNDSIHRCAMFWVCTFGVLYTGSKLYCDKSCMHCCLAICCIVTMSNCVLDE